MKVMLLSLFAVASVFFASFARADCGGSACTNVKITYITANAEGNHWIATDGSESGLSQVCQIDSTNGGQVQLLGTDPGAKDVLANLIAAAMGKKNVKYLKVVARGSNSYCRITDAVVEY